MDTETKVDLIKSFAEEIITEDELRKLFETNSRPIAYDGFEPSGKIHIAQGILRAINVNKMTKAGCKFKMLVADWHAWANNKVGGDLEKIQIVGKYFIELWKQTGMDTRNVEFVWASDYINDNNYLKTLMQIARNSTVNRILRCSQIMGRSESDNLQASQVFYPVMQCADIFQLKVDICQLGMDQRKVNVLAREIGPKIGFYAPVAVHHHMLMGLGEPPKVDGTTEKAIAMKMSKSNPDSAIFMQDSEEEIKRKISKAYCPAKIVEDNPILEYCNYIIFEKVNKLKIERDKKFGGDLVVKDYKELAKIYSKGEVHPTDLKNSVAKELNDLIKPVREHFEKNKKAKELYETVKKFDITR